VRLLVARNGAVRVEQTPLDLGERVVRVRLAAHPIDPSDPFLYHKTTNRSVYEGARLPACDDVVLWNPAGEVTESTMANLVVELEDGRVTPPVACGLLPGTLRAELLAEGELRERPVTVAELGAAPRFWLVNSVRGWCPAALVG
jgi:para-aminobenzoate synthetase/4-amino-4-deoxychorismate lyase